jgi:adenosylcobinamide amidohydrolase
MRPEKIANRPASSTLAMWCGLDAPTNLTADRPAGRVLAREEPVVTKSKSHGTVTHTIVRTRTEADVALRQARLTAEEEKVLRMKYGIPIDPVASLEAPGLETDARVELEAMEKRATAAVAGSVDSGKRNAIIERMRKM